MSQMMVIDFDGCGAGCADFENDAFKSMPLFVLIYSDDCFHCKQLKPLIEEAAAHEYSTPICLIKAQTQNAVTEMRKVLKFPASTGVPSLFGRADDGVWTEFDASRTVDNLVAFFEPSKRG